MKTRRDFVKYILLGISSLVALLVAACGGKPDAKTEPSPEWPPKEEKS
jgi:hypothetical protein